MNFMNAPTPVMTDGVQRMGRKVAEPAPPAGMSSEEQLRAAQLEQAQGGTPEQEAAARRAGFKNYNEMVVYERNKQNKTGGTTGKGLMDQLLEHPMHPRNMFNYINDALKKATGQ
jgi:hypothetical protein